MCDPLNGRAELSGGSVRIEEGGRQDPYSKTTSNSKKLKRIWLVVSKGWPRLKRNGDAIGRDLQLATLVNFTTRSIRESKLPYTY